jgi:glycosyltransferase involved in cell wall biosynthesis
VSRPIRTVLFSTLYPSVARPLHGIFVETRLRELLTTGAVQTRVVAPVPWFPSADDRFGEYARMARTPAREQRHGVDVQHPRYLLLPKIGMNLAPLAMALAAAPALRALIHEGFDFDLIDAHYYYPDGVAAALLARHFRKPLAITARGTDLNLIPQHALPRRMIRWAARRADASIGVCAALVDVLRGWGIAESRLHVMRNGVDLGRFHPEPPAAARLQLGIEGAPVLLSVGHLIERKGHHLAIGALPAVLQRHPQARLLIVGEGPERPRLEALAGALGVQARVTLTGALPNDTLATWYSAADVLILASSREGWANVLLEAMACGTPVVATRIWGTPEVVADAAVGLLVEQRSPEGLAASLVQLLASPRDRGHVRRYAEGFGWPETSQAQVNLFRTLAASGVRHA